MPIVLMQKKYERIEIGFIPQIWLFWVMEKKLLKDLHETTLRDG